MKFINLPLAEYLDDLLGSIENGVEQKEIDHAKGKYIAALDPDEEFVHVEFPNELSPAGITKPVIWRIKPWRASYARYIERQRRAELERAARFRREDAFKKLTECIFTTFHGAIPKNTPYINNLANNIINEKNYKAAINFGYTTLQKDLEG